MKKVFLFLRRQIDDFRWLTRHQAWSRSNRRIDVLLVLTLMALFVDPFFFVQVHRAYPATAEWREEFVLPPLTTKTLEAYTGLKPP